MYFSSNGFYEIKPPNEVDLSLDSGEEKQPTLLDLIPVQFLLGLGKDWK